LAVGGAGHFEPCAQVTDNGVCGRGAAAVTAIDVRRLERGAPRIVLAAWAASTSYADGAWSENEAAAGRF